MVDAIALQRLLGIPTRSVAMLLLAAGLVACEPPPEPGTLAAIEACVEENASDLVPSEVIRARCAEQNETAITGRILTGTAGYRRSVLDNSKIDYSGHVRNTSTDVVVTSFSISIQPKEKTAECVAKEARVEEIEAEHQAIIEDGGTLSKDQKQNHMIAVLNEGLACAHAVHNFKTQWILPEKAFNFFIEQRDLRPIPTAVSPRPDWAIEQVRGIRITVD